MTKIIGCKFDRDEIVIYRHKKEIIDAHTQKLLEEERKKVRKDDVVVVDMGYTNHATFYLDASCFENEALVPNSKWAVVYQDAFAEAQIQHKTIPSSLWALNEGRVPIDYLGMKRHYKIGNSLTVKLLENSQSVYYYGYIQKVIVFTDRPEEGFSFSIIPVSRPRISFAYFENSEKNWRYGEIVNLSIHYHNLCTTNHDTLFSQVFIVEANEANAAIKAEEGDDIDLESLKESSVWQSGEFKMAQVDKKATGFNSRIPFSVLIDYEKWRKGEAKEKTFSLIVVVYRTEYPYNIKSEKVVSFRNFITNPTKDLYQYNPETLSLKDINIKEDAISSRIVVQKDFMSEILAKREIEVNNMIQYVGDIEYNRKENNPCAFSVITVNKDKQDIVVFDEYKLNQKVNDQTKRFIDIVIGDGSKKQVRITAKFKKNKEEKLEAVRTDKNGYICEAILNDGKKHYGIRDVFKMSWIVGQWIPSKDPAIFNTYSKNILGINMPLFYHPTNGLSAPKLEWNKSDQEAKGIVADEEQLLKYQVVTVAGIQGLTTKDYIIDEESDSITLELQYRYDKMYNSRISYYLYEEQEYFKEGILSDNIKNLWVVNYLLKWIKNEPLEQLYFVPVTTCRYPNQLVKLRVFPNIKWVLNFNYNIETPIYYKSSTALETYYSGFHEQTDVVTSSNKKRKDLQDKNVTNILQPYVGSKTSFGLSVECEVGGGEGTLKLGKDFAEKYRKMLAPLLSIINILDENLGVSAAQKEEKNIRERGSLGLLSRLDKLPMSFELKPPSLGVGLGIGYVSTEKGTIAYELEGKIKANPIIGANVKLDILALGSKFKPWGAIIEALDLVSWASNVFSGGRVELDYELYFELKAEIKLVGAGSKDGETKPAHMTYNFTDQKYKGDIALQGYLEGKLVASIRLEIYVKKKKKRSFEGQYYNEGDKEKATKLGVSLEGKSFVTLTASRKFGKENNWGSDFYFSGFTLMVTFDAQIENKEIEPIKIIPKVEANVDVLKGIFEIK
ncbi:hypothetical protein [Flavobacterium oreochromis]|uniref:Uncharacterized protein n=1 Tax=Flavobacterium columnare TaxID=996 RepID=A0A246G894_9FLAO|nr:hypothetical protein [Flavobacterium oreochromis]OWP75014.1 hypothetical protein BWK62_12970 [Flavobacterium oreochromis]